MGHRRCLLHAPGAILASAPLLLFELLCRLGCSDFLVKKLLVGDHNVLDVFWKQLVDLPVAVVVLQVLHAQDYGRLQNASPLG